MPIIESDVEKLEWNASVPIFQNATILKQLAIAIGIPFGLVCLFLFFAGTGTNRIYSLYGMAAIAILFIVTYLLIQIMYGGKYAVGFVLDSNGITCYTLPRQARKNRIVNGLLVFLGLLTGKPSAAGTGLLAESRQVTFLKWDHIKKIAYSPKQFEISLRGKPTERITLFCSPENYTTVKAIIINKTESNPSVFQKPGDSGK